MKTIRNLIAISILSITALIIGYRMIPPKKERNNFKAIIFDMDGTIINTDHLWKAANRPILDEFAPHLTLSEKDLLVGAFKHLTFYEIWTIIQKISSTEMSLRELGDLNTTHVERMYETDGISFIPHFDTFHSKVKTLDLKCAIATSSQKRTVDIILRAVPLEDYFGEHIYHVDHVNKAFKPNPAVYLHAALMLEVDPCDCIAIEDSLSGVKAAKAAGMYCIGINTGKNLTLLAQADQVVDCFSEIDIEKLLSK